MQLEPEEAQQNPAVAAFIAELRHWREVAGYSQKALAKVVGYTPSYVSKVERGTMLASRSFAESADQHLRAGRALVRRWRDMHEALVELTEGRVRHDEPAPDDPQSAPGPDLVVEHEQAELTYRDGMYQTRIRRHLHNTGEQPVTQYLVRIAVDRYPGDPERSNRLYREDPLTWEEIGLSAMCGDEPMSWHVKHDRDAFKEVWLLFENADGRFPLYPGEMTWISYVYTVRAHKWGPWWARAIRLPTRRLSMTAVFPARLQPVVWGITTSMTAEASPFPTSISRQENDDQVVFSWSADDPPLHARYRVEWKFRAPDEGETSTMETMGPAERMRSLAIAQDGDPVLAEVARPFDLPAEAEDARRVVAQLVSTLERVGQVHNFAKGMGLAAPGSVGRALPSQQVKAVRIGDDGSWADCTPGETGRQQLRCPLGNEPGHDMARPAPLLDLRDAIPGTHWLTVRGSRQIAVPQRIRSAPHSSGKAANRRPSPRSSASRIA